MTNKSFHVGTVRHYLSFFLASLFGAGWYVDALDNGLARTPPMGWLSWERFGCLTNCRDYPDDCISEKLYLAQAEILVSDGYRDAGYVYVNIDDCWSEKERDPETGKLVPDKERFPNGIHGLAESLHSMKLKIGLYGDIGTATCEGYPGFQQHYTLDAQTLADWQVDSIKVDACNADENLFNDSYPEFGRELNKTGRPILYSCSWPNDYYEHHHHWEIPDYLNHGIKQTCNIWRNYFDIHDSWESVSKTIDFWARNSSSDVMVRASGPGHFNDPDMLVIGNPGLSLSEQQSQFSLWAIFSAPLFISADLREMNPESRDLLLNEEIIAVNQDALGRQGWCAEQTSFSRVWVRELTPSKASLKDPIQGSSDRWAVVLQNYRTVFNERNITFDPNRHFNATPSLGMEWHFFSVRDLIHKKDLGVFEGKYSSLVDESSVAMLLVTLQQDLKRPASVLDK